MSLQISLSQEEKDFCSKAQLPCYVSPYMNKILLALEKEWLAGKDNGWFYAMRRQLVPSPNEAQILPYELVDPLGAGSYQVTSRAVHQYKNRLLILTTAKCFSYCRHCFRRSYTAHMQGWISIPEQEEILLYLKEHPEIQEVLFSGGDPLTACDQELEEFILRLRSVSPGLLVRICTRAPVFFPERITDSLIAMFKRQRPLWVIPHVNHPAEVSAKFALETEQAFMRLADGGIPVQSQTVLLKGVNDSVNVLAELFHRLVCLGIKPGYLFQGDLAAGTSHLRVPIEQGLKLYEALRKELSGLSTPVYAVDLPGGGGKINLLQLNDELLDIKVLREKESYQFVKKDGSVWNYPLN